MTSARRLVWLLVATCFISCRDCSGGPPKRETPMCGPCAGTGDCRPGLACLNGVCETAPPSCHVQIGL